MREAITYFIRPCGKCGKRKNIMHILKGADLIKGVQNSYFKCDSLMCQVSSYIGEGLKVAIEKWNKTNGGHSLWWELMANVFIWRSLILFAALSVAVIGWASMCTGKIFAHGGNDFDNVVMSGKISVVKIVSEWNHAHLVYEVPVWVEMDSVARGIIEKDMFIIVLPDSSIEYISRQDGIYVQADVKMKLN